MASTMVPKSYNGASPGTGATVDGIVQRFNTSDTLVSSGVTNPLVRPSVGSYYSYWKTYGLDCTVTPVGTANNLRFYTDGTNPTVGVLWWGMNANVGADGGYRQATGTTGLTGTQLTTGNHSGLTTTPVDIFTWTSSIPLSLSGSIVNPSTGRWSDFIVVQIEVQTTAPSGALSQETFTYVWDET